MQPRQSRKLRDTPDAMQGWHYFFVAEAGTSTALAGLLFVAISINLTRIPAPKVPREFLPTSYRRCHL